MANVKDIWDIYDAIGQKLKTFGKYKITFGKHLGHLAYVKDIWQILKTSFVLLYTRSLGALRAPTSSLEPFGPL